MSRFTSLIITYKNNKYLFIKKKKIIIVKQTNKQKPNNYSTKSLVITHKVISPE